MSAALMRLVSYGVLAAIIYSAMRPWRWRP